MPDNMVWRVGQAKDGTRPDEGGSAPRMWVADLLLMLAGVVVLNLPALMGLVHADPRLLLSGLGVDIRPGLLGGHGPYLDPNSAWTTQDLGHLVAQDWLAGIVPWWNPALGVGVPLAAEMQPAAFFLPFVLLLHFDQGWLWLHMLLQAVSAAGAYALARQLGLTRTACLAAAILFGCNGTLAWFSHGPERVAAFLPWLLLGIERCRIGQQGAAWLGVALALSITAGFPETAYLDGLLAAAWTLLRITQSPVSRRFAARVATGLIAGLLLAAPAIWPFVHYLTQGDTGGHALMAYDHLSAAAMATLVLPYAQGPLNTGGPALEPLWGSIGGYLGPLTIALALAGTFAGGAHTGLRRLLAVWLLVCIARMAGVWPVMVLSNLVPLVSQTAFYRYIPPTLSLAAAVLAACAIDTWQQRLHTRRHAGSAAAAGLAAILLALGAFALSGPATIATRLSLGLGVGCILMLALALGGPPSRRARAGLLLLIGTEAGGLTLMASAGAPLGGTIDTAPARFLQDHVGLERILSLRGGLMPNETARHGLSGIDSTMLPAPRSWATYVRSTLHADPIALLHNDTGLNQIARDWPLYRSLGVGWLVTGAGYGAANWNMTADPLLPHVARPLQPDRALTGILAAGLPGSAPTRRVGIDIGTYLGRADGSLRLVLSAPGLTATGTAPLARARDNAPLDIALDQSVPAGVPLGWSLTQIQARHPVAIWLYGGAPRFSTAASWPGFSPVPVYTDGHMEIDRLPDPAPYMQATGCTLRLYSRSHATALCPTATALLRRELYFPGWRATLDGVPTPISREGLFQRLTLPAGPTDIRFHYAPPYIEYAYALCLLGMLLTLALTRLRVRLR